MFYDKYVELCAKKGMTPSAAAKEIGINKAAVSNWKYRKNGPSDITTKKIADYFGVSVSELMDEKENAPTQKGERIEFDDFTYAMQNETKDLTDMDKQILLSMAKQLNDARKQRNGETG